MGGNGIDTFEFKPYHYYTVTSYSNRLNHIFQWSLTA